VEGAETNRLTKSTVNHVNLFWGFSNGSTNGVQMIRRHLVTADKPTLTKPTRPGLGELARGELARGEFALEAGVVSEVTKTLQKGSH